MAVDVVRLPSANIFSVSFSWIVSMAFNTNSRKNRPFKTARLPLAAAIGVALLSPPIWAADDVPQASVPSKPAKTKPKLDRSGDKKVGKASIYSHKFTNKKMADGNKMDPLDDNAASKTLPLGTRAKVTNLETGQSTEVTIQDRGPYVKGRIVDLPPGKAEEIGLTLEKGVAKVEVAPIEVPLRDGGVKFGEGAETKEN
jgi:rare lipoprotein A